MPADHFDYRRLLRRDYSRVDQPAPHSRASAWRARSIFTAQAAVSRIIAAVPQRRRRRIGIFIEGDSALSDFIANTMPRGTIRAASMITLGFTPLFMRYC